MYATVRRGELWWDDLNFYCNEVRRQQARPWMWADKLWDCTDEEFRHNVPLDVIQSNWYYSNHFELERTVPGAENFNRQTAAYLRLDRMGYDQIPAGSNWWCFENYRGTVEFCEKQLAPEHLLGFMTAPWYPTDETSLEILLEGCDQIKTGLLAPRLGNTYSGAVPLGLAAVLDIAKPGDRIFITSYGSGSGSDAFDLTVTDAILDKIDRTKGPSVEAMLAAGKYLDYAVYARHKGKIKV